MVIVWVHMETWLVQEEAAGVVRGSQLRWVGLRADCLSLGPARTVVDGIEERAAPRGHGARCHRYDLTGTAGPAADVYTGVGPGQRVGSEFVITAGDQAFAALTAQPASMIATGSRLTVQCTLSVMADYEWEAFGLPDLRRDWCVRRLKIEYRQVGHFPVGPGHPLARHPGNVLRTWEIENTSQRADDPDPAITACYLLDLVPLQES
jgi:hypothetical protein